MRLAPAYLGLLCCAAPLVSGCPSSPQPEPQRLKDTLPWHGENRQKLDKFMAEHGSASESYDEARKPVAVLDWDNTVIKNDIGDATLFSMVRKDKVRQPPEKNWRATSPFLTEEAAGALSAACDNLAEPGEPLPTAQNAPCATEIITLYTKGKTTTGKDAFTGWDRRRMEPAYAWAAQLQGGLSAADSRDIAAETLRESLAAGEGATQKIGDVDGLTAWLRIYEQQRDLIGALTGNGFDVWVVSASPQPWVEAAAREVGVAPERVIGIRMVERGGKLSYDVQGCGDVPDGQSLPNQQGNTMITYIEGKRCWINKVIYGDKSPAAISRQSDPARRPLFGAGDSVTDLSFLQDATLRLVLNRNKAELMCHAYNDPSTWLVNPMFIKPLPRRATPYPCATTACTSSTGAQVPCLDEAGKVIPDQEDRVAPAS